MLWADPGQQLGIHPEGLPRESINSPALGQCQRTAPVWRAATPTHNLVAGGPVITLSLRVWGPRAVKDVLNRDQEEPTRASQHPGSWRAASTSALEPGKTNRAQAGASDDALTHEGNGSENGQATTPDSSNMPDVPPDRGIQRVGNRPTRASPKPSVAFAVIRCCCGRSSCARWWRQSLSR